LIVRIRASARRRDGTKAEFPENSRREISDGDGRSEEREHRRTINNLVAAKRHGMTVSKFARAWIVILAVGLAMGLLGVLDKGWQHPADSIGIGVWTILAVCVIVIVRRQNQPPTSK
jgi:uncharacterized membrane protein